MKRPRLLGCHLSSADGYYKMGLAASSIGANTFAFFTRNPRGGNVKALDIDDIEKLGAYLAEHEFGPLVAHAPYTYNLCSATPKTREFALRSMKEDLDRLEYLPGHYYNFHPGSHVGQGAERGIEMIASMLNEIIRPEQHTMILLESMAGKGSEVGGRFEELAAIRDKLEHPERVGICLDTCHIYDGGYDIVSDPEGVLREFDAVVGLEYVKALHVNDSKNGLGSHKDRHAPIGEGEIGYKAIRTFIDQSALAELPAILETPQESLEGYAREIAMLRA